MSCLSTYLVSVQTNATYNREEYDAAAEKLEGMMQGVFGSEGTMADVCPVTSAENAEYNVELEIEHEEGGLIGRALVDILAPMKVTLDKARLSKVIKARPEASAWPAMKILKRAAEAERLTSD